MTMNSTMRCAKWLEWRHYNYTELQGKQSACHVIWSATASEVHKMTEGFWTTKEVGQFREVGHFRDFWRKSENGDDHGSQREDLQI